MLRSIGEHNCGLTGGIFLFKFAVFLRLGFLVKLVTIACGLLKKNYILKNFLKKEKNYCAEGACSVTLSSPFTQSLVYEFLYPTFMILVGWSGLVLRVPFSI